MARVPRTKAELKSIYHGKLSRVHQLCDIFDKGEDYVACELANQIYMLVYDPERGGRTESVMQQLGIKDRDFITCAEVLQPPNWDAESAVGEYRPYDLGLVALDPGSTPPRWIPTLMMDAPRMPYRQWWGQTVLRDNLSSVGIGRGELVMDVRNTDGGAHVDKTLPEKYAHLRDPETYQIVACTFDRMPEVGEEIPVSKPDQSPIAATVRAIAHELLATVSKSYQPPDVRTVGRAVGTVSFTFGREPKPGPPRTR